MKSKFRFKVYQAPSARQPAPVFGQLCTAQPMSQMVSQRNLNALFRIPPRKRGTALSFAHPAQMMNAEPMLPVKAFRAQAFALTMMPRVSVPPPSWSSSAKRSLYEHDNIQRQMLRSQLAFGRF